MRPNLGELLAGVNRTVMSVSMPIVQQSGDMQSLWEVATSSRLLSYIESRWKNEFGRLARENTAMEELLTEVVPALTHLGHPLAAELGQTLEAARCRIEDLPSVDLLEKANTELKAGLEKFIFVHANMEDPGRPGLEAVRQKIRELIKEINSLDFEAAQSIIFF